MSSEEFGTALVRDREQQNQSAGAEEIELKFLGPEDAIERARKVPALRKFANGRRFQTQALRSIYYDTPDFALRDQGLILRVREEGGRFVQTVKSARNTNIASRSELNGEVPSGEISLDAIEDRKTHSTVKAAAKASPRSQRSPRTLHCRSSASNVVTAPDIRL